MAENKKKKNKDSNFDLKAFIMPYVEKWYYFVISAVIFTALGFVYTKTRSPQYLVQANVLIAQSDNGGLDALSEFGTMFGNTGDVDDEIFVITSHYVYVETAQRLGLNISHYVKPNFLKKVFVYKKYPVTVELPEELADTLSNSLEFHVEVDHKTGLADIVAKANHKLKLADLEQVALPASFNTEYGPFTIVATENFPEGEDFEDDLDAYINVNSYNAVAESLSAQVESNISNKRTHVIGLSMTTPSPAYGVDVLNTMIEIYNEREIAQKSLQNAKTLEFIEERLVQLNDEINAANTDIQNFKEENDVISVQWDSEYTYKLKGETAVSLIAAKTNSEQLKLVYDFISNPANAYEVMPTVSEENRNLSSTIGEYNKLILKRMEIATDAREGNMALKQISDQIDAMRVSIVNSLKKAYEGSLVAVRDLTAQMNEADQSLGNLPEIERQFGNLYRDYTVKAQLYQYLLRQHEETAMLMANAIPKGEIIDEAYVSSEPVGMSNKVIYFAFFLLGLCVAAGIIYLRRAFKNKFTARQELESASSVPILGEIGISRCETPLIVGNGSGSSNAELFRLMRSNLQFVLNDWEDKVVLVTSTKAGEGKSFISINLAASFAILKKRVLLVGMDIRKPRLAKYLNLDAPEGLTTYLSTPNTDINKFINKNVGVEGLDVLTAGPVPPNPAELLASEKLDVLFDKLREVYDYIIIDSAPVGMVADTFTLNRLANATVYVTRMNVTTLRDLAFVDEMYTEHRLRKLSVVVNGVNLRKKGYGYGYGYGESHNKKVKE